MKKLMLTIGAGFILGLSTLTATAQEDVRPIPSWVSDRGYWVVETHADSSIVYFYNNDSQLMYKETTAPLNTRRKKTKLWLTKHLEQVVTAWENRKDPSKAISRQNPPLYRQMMDGVPGLSSY